MILYHFSASNPPFLLFLPTLIDRPTKRRTKRPFYRDARTHLKKETPLERMRSAHMPEVSSPLVNFYSSVRCSLSPTLVWKCERRCNPHDTILLKQKTSSRNESWVVQSLLASPFLGSFSVTYSLLRTFGRPKKTRDRWTDGWTHPLIESWLTTKKCQKECNSNNEKKWGKLQKSNVMCVSCP